MRSTITSHNPFFKNQDVLPNENDTYPCTVRNPSRDGVCQDGRGIMSNVVPSDSATGGKSRSDGRFYHLQYPSLGRGTEYTLIVCVSPARSQEIAGWFLFFYKKASE